MPPKKNPVKPKGKMTAYAFFVNACRLEHHNQFPGQKIKLSEFSTVCAKRWKEMTMDQKRPFVEMADRDKMRYENELKLLFPGESQPKRRRKKKDPNAPKKNLSPFFIFSKLKRPEIMKDHPSKGVGEISKVLSAEWSNMSDDDKAQYVRMSEEDKIRYQKQLEQYKGTNTTAGVVSTNMMVAPITGEEDEDDEEEDEDEFNYGGGHPGGNHSGVPMTSAQNFQGQQSMMAVSTGPGGPPSMVTSTVQQGTTSQSSVNNQQFANGQAQMYQQGVMMQQQTNMMGSQQPQQQQMNQFNNANNPQMQQLIQQQQQQQQSQSMQNPMHGTTYNTQNNHQSFMNPAAAQQQPRMMQAGGPGTQQMQQQQQPEPNQQQMGASAVVTSSNHQNPQFMMSISNGPRGANPNNAQYTSQSQMMMQQAPQQQQQQPQMQQHPGAQQQNVEVQQQMHANQMMNQAAYQQLQQNQISNVQQQQQQTTASSQPQQHSVPVTVNVPSQILTASGSTTEDMQQDTENSLPSNILRTPQTSLNGPTPPPVSAAGTTTQGHVMEHFDASELVSNTPQDLNNSGSTVDLNGLANANVGDRLAHLVKERQTPPTSENNMPVTSSANITDKAGGDVQENQIPTTAALMS